MTITIRESLLETAVSMHEKIPEFDEQGLGYYEDRIDDKKSLVIIAYIDDEPAGYLIGYDKSGDGSFYCWLAGVLPEFRKKGVLKKMMNYLYDWAKRKGYKKIFIKTRNKRKEMLSYLVKNGFDVVKVSKREPQAENRILMEKLLS